MIFNQNLLSGLTIYRQVVKNETVTAWQALMNAISKGNLEQVMAAYHQFIALALEHRWPERMIDLILDDSNLFTRTVVSVGADKINPKIKEMAARDLYLLQRIAQLTAKEVKKSIVPLFEQVESAWNLSPDDPMHPLNWPEWNNEDVKLSKNDKEIKLSPCTAWLHDIRKQTRESLMSGSWSENIDLLAEYHEQVGFGLFGHYAAARWINQKLNIGDGTLRGIQNPDPISFDQLIGIENEKAIIIENTEHFLAGLPSNNVLLYGDRGTGKSSLVKSLLNKYVKQGLRLVEVAKNNLHDFPVICNQLSDEPGKFIIFIDDLSFDDHEPEYKAFKTMLEGGIASRSENILIYATSNRRHLIKETFAERTDEINGRDVQEEKLSLSDRFGITITFPSPDQERFLLIVQSLADQNNLNIDSKELNQLAIRWEMWHNGRSGRTARQFIDHLIAQEQYERAIRRS